MAISGATFISGGLILIMIITNNSSELTIIYFSLLACALAFMIFNWPPARIFMGDSGSIFLGYIIGTPFLLTIKRGDVTVWKWLVLFGYDEKRDAFVLKVFQLIEIGVGIVDSKRLDNLIKD